jgi:hypothetical protein
MAASGENLNMENRFFERPILNSPYKYPVRQVYQIETEFKAKVESEFNKMIEGIVKGEE